MPKINVYTLLRQSEHGRAISPPRAEQQICVKLTDWHRVVYRFNGKKVTIKICRVIRGYPRYMSRRKPLATVKQKSDAIISVWR